ncbi:MAG TPA: SCO family protein [Burkholderiaceae bacterium]|nr:SCO family protein [Burkholderiaceae bacterium]
MRFAGSSRWSFRRTWAVLSAALLAACSPPAFKSVDITGADYAHGFSLESASGGRRSLADFRGKVVAVFFGYTQCPDVCPTTLSDFAEVKKNLGADGDKLQVIFISLDPERDSPALLQQYVPAFDSSFVALYGTPQQTAETAKDFKIFYQKVPGKTPGAYTIDHTAGTFIFDREGRLRLFVRHGTPPADIAADVRRLL